MVSAFIGVQFGVLVALLFGPGSRQDRRPLCGQWYSHAV